MSHTVEFELAAFADAISKANRVAPTKGAALDKASGIVVSLDDSRPDTALILATDLEVSLRQEVNVLYGDITGQPMWRVPSKLLHGLVASMPVTSGGSIILKDIDDGHLYLKYGETMAKLRTHTGGYPVIPVFDRASLVTAPNLSARLAQVAWATDKRGSGVLSGVHMDGTYLIGCDRASAAVVPCAVPLKEPVTAPLKEVAAIIRNTSEVFIGATDHRLNLMPDDHTQASTVLLKEPYPNIMALPQWTKGTDKLTLTPDVLQGMIDRTLVLMKEERLPSTKIEIGDGYLKMEMRTDSGTVIDKMEVRGGHTGEPLKLSFNPEVLRNALSASGRAEVDILYGPTNLDPFVLTDDTGYKALMMAMRDTS